MLYQTLQLRHTRTSRICYDDEEKQNKENLVNNLPLKVNHLLNILHVNDDYPVISL